MSDLTPPDTLPLETRRDMLQAEIRKQLSKGWRVVSQTDTTAQLVNDKKAGCCGCFILAFPLALWRNARRKTPSLYIEIEPNGTIRKT